MTNIFPLVGAEYIEESGTKQIRNKTNSRELPRPFIAVVHQYYQSEVNNEYVIRGNAAILKCSIPSFVAEFVQVVGWQDDQGNSFNPDEDNGIMTTETF